MTKAMQFDLVSPEKKLASLEVNMVQIPGNDGDFAAMADHAPTVSSLRPGILRIVSTTGDIEEYVVSGGFAEISQAGTSVLAERAVLKSEAGADFFDQAVKQAEENVARAGDDAIAKATAEMALNDIKFIQNQLS